MELFARLPVSINTLPDRPVRTGMDERIRSHANTLVDWSARIEAGDDVVVHVGEGAHDLAVAVASQLGDRGANVLTRYDSEEVTRAYLRASDDSFDSNPAFERELYERADCVLYLRGSRNSRTESDIPEHIQTAYTKATEEIQNARRQTDWVSTIHPTRAYAQQAGMSYPAYCDFVYGAILRDWEALAEEMAGLKAILDDGSAVRLRKDDGTDLTMSIENRLAVNSAASIAYGSHNLPSGEVFTAPVETEGTVVFDLPRRFRGQRIRDVALTFEDGEVVDWQADVGESALTTIIETDDGSSRLGELGIGMNRGIDRITDMVLFDEKMAGTVHLALGSSYDACLPDGEGGNPSAVHVDFITDMSVGETELVVDGEVIQRNGVFRWEDGFE